LIEVTIPGRGEYRLEHLVLDLNGTIAFDGDIIEGVPERLELLRELIDIVLITADTRGRAQKLKQSLRVNMHKIYPGNEQTQKLELVKELGQESTVSIGNGSNDASMLRESMLGVCVLGPEGASSEALKNCDLVIPDINAALDLLTKPERLIATLRK
jgi:P-type E1-E2 ATPase